MKVAIVKTINATMFRPQIEISFEKMILPFELFDEDGAASSDDIIRMILEEVKDGLDRCLKDNDV